MNIEKIESAEKEIIEYWKDWERTFNSNRKKHETKHAYHANRYYIELFLREECLWTTTRLGEQFDVRHCTILSNLKRVATWIEIRDKVFLMHTEEVREKFPISFNDGFKTTVHMVCNEVENEKLERLSQHFNATFQTVMKHGLAELYKKIFNDDENKKSNEEDFDSDGLLEGDSQ